MKKLVIPKVPPSSGGGQSTFFKCMEPKHTIRLFPFEHNGEEHLAKVTQVHFVLDGQPPVDCEGAGCKHCAAAHKSGDKRQRVKTQYVMYVVDVDADPDTVLKWNAPTTAYRQIAGVLEESGDDASSLLGNNGTDFYVKYDKTLDPSAQYQVVARMKGSSKLSISDEQCPDQLAEGEEETKTPDANPAPPPPKDEPKLISFTGSDGEVHEGKDTGRRKGSSLYVECEGRLWLINPTQIVEG